MDTWAVVTRQYYEAHRHDKAQKPVHTAIMLTLLLGILLAAFQTELHIIDLLCSNPEEFFSVSAQNIQLLLVVDLRQRDSTQCKVGGVEADIRTEQNLFGVYVFGKEFYAAFRRTGKCGINIEIVSDVDGVCQPCDAVNTDLAVCRDKLNIPIFISKWSQR